MKVTVTVRSEMGVAAMVAVVRASAARKMAGEEVATAAMAAVGMATVVVAVADSASTPCTQHIHQATFTLAYVSCSWSCS